MERWCWFHWSPNKHAFTRTKVNYWEKFYSMRNKIFFEKNNSFSLNISVSFISLEFTSFLSIPNFPFVCFVYSPNKIRWRRCLRIAIGIKVDARISSNERVLQFSKRESTEKTGTLAFNKYFLFDTWYCISTVLYVISSILIATKDDTNTTFLPENDWLYCVT